MEDAADEDVPRDTLEVRVHALQSSSTNTQVHVLEGILAQLQDEGTRSRRSVKRLLIA